MRKYREPEAMDDPTLDAQQHLQALRGLERINRLSGSAQMVWAPIRSWAQRSNPRLVRVLDIATGAGDLPMELWYRAHRTGLRLQIDGCDRSPRAVEYARERAQRSGIDVRFFELDAIRQPVPSGYDVLLSSLFLHHLDDSQAVYLLQQMAQAAKHMVLINDLVRSRTGLVLAYLGTRLLSASDVVRTDGMRSVRAAYTIGELHALAREAGLDGALVARRWPCRFLLVWMRTKEVIS